MILESKKKINIGLIDDDPTFMILLSKVLTEYKEATFNILFMLSSLDELSEMEDTFYEPDIIVCDIDMPEINGIDGLPLLLKRFKKCRVLMCSGLNDLDVVVRAVRSGAHGFVRKVLSRHEFFNAIFHVMEGSMYISLFFMKGILDIVQFKVFHFDDLTDRELEVVNGILKGMSYKLVRYKNNGSVNTVRGHIKRIYKKLNISTKENYMP